LDNFGIAPSYRVGLFIEEEIINADQDESLYDNSKGFSNYTAPGADRLKISTRLIKKSLDDFNDQNFVELIRFKNGFVENLVEKTEYNILAEEFARRTFDESGDYYITPFSMVVRESLNDRLGNNGLYTENELTSNNNIPSENSLVYKISPGKAYIRGYEVSKGNTTLIDAPKPRSTKTVNLEGISFDAGPSLFVNNSLGQPTVGLGTTSYLSLRDSRIGSNKTTPAGNEIGVARAYDYEYVYSTGITTEYKLRIFDLQTYTTLELNQNIDLPKSVLIQGTSSGSKGYVKNTVTNSSTITLYDVNGKFVIDEGIIVSGVGTFGHTVKSTRDYGISDIKSIYSYKSGATNDAGFNADLILNKSIQPNSISIIPGVSLPSPSFKITSKDPDTGISTITSPSTNFIGFATVGNIVSYSIPGFSTITFNKVTSVSSDGKTLGVTSVTSVNEVCDGNTSTDQITVSNLTTIFPTFESANNNSYVSKLTKTNIARVNTEETDIVLKRQYNIASFSANSITGPTLETDYIYQPFSEQRYTLTYSNGKIENLSPDKFTFTNGFKNLTINNLSVASGTNATLIVTVKKSKVKSKTKKNNKVNSITISRSSFTASGVGATTLNDGLTYSNVYGTRVQDSEISLNVPDVNTVLGIFESNDSSDPELPTMTFVSGSLTGPNNNASDLIIGDTITGTNSNSVAIVISKSISQIEFVYISTFSTFVSGEVVSFKESGVTGIISNIDNGDKNITDKYVLDNGQRINYYDFSKINRKDSNYTPTRKIKIVFQNYFIESGDIGDVVTVNSYPEEKYKDLYFINDRPLSDVVDIRPIVLPYDTTSTYSPFEFSSRNFALEGSYYIAPNETFLVGFDYYLPRIDRLSLSKDGTFQLSVGVPDDNPSPPQIIDGSLNVATIILPPYLRTVKDAAVSYSSHKRYRMQDIARLESRIQNVEYYTQLSLLELSAESLSVKVNGLDRFKSGFFVDNFKSHTSHDISSIEFKASIDKDQGYLRPLNHTTLIDLILASKTIGLGANPDPTADYSFEEYDLDENVKKNKKIITLDYSEQVYAQNVFATRVENVTPFLVTSYTGILELNPSSDTWLDAGTIETNTVNVEGSYQALSQGFNGFEWSSWKTDWIGIDAHTKVSLDIEKVISDPDIKQKKYKTGKDCDGCTKLVQETTTKTTSEDLLKVKSATTSSAELKQTKTGVKFNVSEKIDSVNLGQKLVSSELIKYMRSRNIEFVAKKLKPKTLFYPFFDSVNVYNNCFPKLLQVQMTNGIFQVGETVECNDINNPDITTCTFRVATANHKYGPYNSPTDVFAINPYSESDVTLSNAYTSTSTILNVDTSSLQEAAIGNFFGVCREGFELIGQTSGARAIVSSVRLVSDDVGTLIGSFFVPEEPIQFETGVKNFRLINTESFDPTPGTQSSFAQNDFYAQGLLTTAQDTQLNIKNASVNKENLQSSTESVFSETKKASVSTDQIFFNEQTNVEKTTKTLKVYKDPLAQSFVVENNYGIFVTKLDLYFYSKPTNGSKDSVIVQLRPVEQGVPSAKVIADSEVELKLDNINLSEDGTVATTVTFPAPIFLEAFKEYAIVLLSDSTDYQVWISRMGEEDITTKNLPESAKKIVSQQPFLGSLFKSQNGSTWEPSSYEDLKFTLYNAQFTTDPATVLFFNPIEGGDYTTLSHLSPDSVRTLSNKVLIGLSTSVTLPQISQGVSIGITDTTMIGNLVGVAGSVKLGYGLTSLNVGSGYTNTVYQGLDLETVTGEGTGLKVDVTFQNNKLDLTDSGAGIVTVVSGGYGYRSGDVVKIPSTVSFGSGATLSVVTIGQFNTVILDNVQGTYDSSSVIGKQLTYETSTGITSYVGVATVSYLNQNAQNDGLHFRVFDINHGMYSTNNLVSIKGVKSDVKPAKLSATYDQTSTTPIPVDSISIFSTFENVGVSTTNPGYVKIGKELISYTGIDSNNNTLTGITRGVDVGIAGNSSATQHNSGSSVMKYELNYVSLRRINRIHNMSTTPPTVPNPIEIDSYHIKLNMNDIAYGVDRSGNSDFPNLFFNETKDSNTFDYAVGESIESSKNIIFSTVTPNVNIFTPPATGYGARIRTTSARSVDGTETPFQDLGFEQVELNEINNLSSVRMIASKVNEDSKMTDLPANKSFTMAIDIATGDPNVSPVIDLERVSAILTLNRINQVVADWTTPSPELSLTKQIYDEHAATYVSKKISLTNPATSIKVLFGANRPSTADIKVLYRIYRKDSAEALPSYELFPGYENLDNLGNVINPAANTGSSDVFVPPSSGANEFFEYEYSANDLPEFTDFDIKIIMTGTDQANVPLIKELRVVALA